MVIETFKFIGKKMAIKRIHIENFRSIKELDFEPTMLTALIGKNNVGKSNILSAIELLLGERWPPYAIKEEDLHNHDERLRGKIELYFTEPIVHIYYGRNIEIDGFRLEFDAVQGGNLSCIDGNGRGILTQYGKLLPLSNAIRSKVPGVLVRVDRDLSRILSASQWTILGKILKDISDTAIVPHTKEIFERLLKPLKAAKKNYCLGDYPSTIASCGIVDEMLAILLWKINDVRLKGQPITEEDEKGLFGSTFEKLGQDRRLKILKTFGHINEVQHENFMVIKSSRRPYLHLSSVDLKNERKDALDTFKKAFQLFKEVTGIGLAGAGKVKVNPLLIRLFESAKEKEKK